MPTLPVDVFTFLVLSLVAYRVTRFVVYDTLVGTSLDSGSGFSQRVNLFAFTVTGQDRSWWRGKVGELITCPFCLGQWVGTGFVVAQVLWPRAARIVTAGFAAIGLGPYTLRTGTAAMVGLARLLFA